MTHSKQINGVEMKETVSKDSYKNEGDVMSCDYQNDVNLNVTCSSGV
jgi:hypothetical protein